MAAWNQILGRVKSTSGKLATSREASIVTLMNEDAPWCVSEYTLLISFDEHAITWPF